MNNLLNGVFVSTIEGKRWKEREGGRSRERIHY